MRRADNRSRWGSSVFISVHEPERNTFPQIKRQGWHKTPVRTLQHIPPRAVVCLTPRCCWSLGCVTLRCIQQAPRRGSSSSCSPSLSLRNYIYLSFCLAENEVKKLSEKKYMHSWPIRPFNILPGSMSPVHPHPLSRPRAADPAAPHRPCKTRRFRTQRCGASCGRWSGGICPTPSTT